MTLWSDTARFEVGRETVRRAVAQLTAGYRGAVRFDIAALLGLPPGEVVIHDRFMSDPRYGPSDPTHYVLYPRKFGRGAPHPRQYRYRTRRYL
jgi:hypothetical protein